jgi:hypothetical protein
MHAATTEVAEEVLGEDAHAEYVPGAALPDPDHNIASQLSYAFVRLADQRIAAAEQAPVNHSAKLIAQRAGTIPDVRVIQLRHDPSKRGRPPRGRLVTPKQFLCRQSLPKRRTRMIHLG